MKPRTTELRQLFGIRVRDLRKGQMLSQEGLANEIGLHRTYIGAIERGEESVSLDNAARIAKVLRVSLSDLVVGL